MAKRVTINFLLDLAGFILLVLLAVTGSIMKYILPPGSGGRGQTLHDGPGREHIKTLMSMSRHEWGNIHFILAILFLIAITLHIYLHWGWIKNYVKSHLFGKTC